MLLGDNVLDVMRQFGVLLRQQAVLTAILRPLSDKFARSGIMNEILQSGMENKNILTFALVFDKGDEVISALKQFATEQRLLASHFTAIGASSDAVVGFFDPVKKDYERITIPEQMEVLSLSGDVTIENDVPKIHAHVVVGKSDGTAHGGHLMEAHVFPALELILVESPKFLKRRFDQETGFALIDLDAA